MDMTSRRSRPRALAGLVIALALVAAACGGSDSDVESAGGEGGSSDVLDASVLSGQATTVAGDSFDLGTLADKDLVVWFWAPW